MKALHVTTLITLLLLSHSLLQASSECQQSKQEYVKVESKWSALYSEASFLQDELNRLENISRDSKIILDILNISSEHLSTDGKLSKTETATINLRVPKNRGTLFRDGSFAITGHEAKSLKESQKILNNILKWSSEGVTQMQGNLAFINPQITQLHQKITSLELTIAKVCTDDMPLESLEKEYTTANDQAIADRFSQREKERYNEVSNRRWSDIERSWVNRYYNNCRYHPCVPMIGVRY